uniref:Uncharacterized protein n=1 Tax=Anopheles quadriannulatus TaxID=34691 RepID=A0A182XU39_ANOQN
MYFYPVLIEDQWRSRLVSYIVIF